MVLHRASILLCIVLLQNIYITFIVSKSVAVSNNNETQTAFTTKIDSASNSIKENKTVKIKGNTDSRARAIARSSTNSGVCGSNSCIKVSKKIKDALNESADPCDDFYNFACGGWQDKNKIPESENEITSFTVLTKEIENAIHELIQEPSKPGESEALVKARDFFKSCMDIAKIDELGAKPANDFIESVGGWSICKNEFWVANESKWDQYEILKRIQKGLYPAPPFFTVEVTNDHLNSTKHLIKVRKL